MNFKNKQFLFWGIMDALAFLSYCFFSLTRHRIPFISDIREVIATIDIVIGGDSAGTLLIGYFICELLMLVSLLVSAYLFLRKKTAAITFAFVQEILRFITMKCSIAIFPIVLTVTGFSVLAINVGLFLLSEMIKIGSLMYCRKKQSAEHTAP
ncbi:putative membrane protein [Trabulsiella guamensis ATCC 49490]|uniref:Putative membrane protein n=1 Tax=Trabulsiella guamensis ATCC 49490 TaxID=1005994 RepID=A0A084ZU84_9ENTR|nr:hypothetical protein [Trabulsiella guamensis]KFC01029.1 putative membrane protein [Trabulsiella guamensis ATCC 49490]